MIAEWVGSLSIVNYEMSVKLELPQHLHFLLQVLDFVFFLPSMSCSLHDLK